MSIRVRIDFDADPSKDAKAKQVVYLEGVYEPMDVHNIIGKYITNVQYEKLNNCLVLTLDENLPEGNNNE